MVSGPPMIATARPLMPTRAQIVGEIMCSGLTPPTIRANALPSTAPRNNEAKNKPPRKPEPIEIADASAFSSTSSSRWVRVYSAPITTPTAPWPDDSTAGV